MARFRNALTRVVIDVDEETAATLNAREWKADSGSSSAPSEPVAVPEGAPTDQWTVPQLKAYAEANSIDLAGATRKDDVLAAVTAGK